MEIKYPNFPLVTIPDTETANQSFDNDEHSQRSKYKFLDIGVLLLRSADLLFEGKRTVPRDTSRADDKSLSNDSSLNFLQIRRSKIDFFFFFFPSSSFFPPNPPYFPTFSTSVVLSGVDQPTRSNWNAIMINGSAGSLCVAGNNENGSRPLLSRRRSRVNNIRRDRDDRFPPRSSFLPRSITGRLPVFLLPSSAFVRNPPAFKLIHPMNNSVMN